MPFVDTNSLLKTKLYNFDSQCKYNSESYEQHGFFRTKIEGGQTFKFMLGGFSNKRDYSIRISWTNL